MLNRITRKIPVSRYKVKYTEDGTEREIVFETLSGLKTGELIGIAETKITNPESKIFVSTDIEETPLGVHIFETSLVRFLEIAYSVDVINHKEE